MQTDSKCDSYQQFMAETWRIYRLLSVIALISIVMQHSWIGYITNINTTMPDEQETLKSAFPLYHVGVLTKPFNKSSFWCGGTLISKKYVLTAAHCLERCDFANIIIPGSHNATENHSLKSTKIKRHPKWEPRLLQNDLALIELPQTPDIPDLSPICFASNGKITSRLGTVYGWDKRSQNQNLQPVLRKKTVTIAKNKDCRNTYGLLITKNSICAKGTGSEDCCHGFSGSGLVVDDVLVGVLSFGTDPCNSGYPTVYVKVSRYKKWIEGILEG